MSWLAWSSLARAFSPVSRARPTVTMKFTPILDFIEIGGLVSSAQEQGKMLPSVVFYWPTNIISLFFEFFNALDWLQVSLGAK
jgi:hypothetical protein